MLPLALHCSAAEKDLRAALMVGLMGESGGNRLFYYPTKDLAETPSDYGCQYQDIYFHAADGVKLHAWWMPAKGEARATVVYSHGNAGSLGHHIIFVYWLVEAGYNVMMYDYRGYGKSAGKLTKSGAVKDAQAAFRYAASRKEAGGIVSIGYSIGGAKSIAALALSPPKELRAVIVDSTFASYRDMAEKMVGKRARKVVTASYEPYTFIAKLPEGVPLLVMHGTSDATIPFTQAEKLFEAAKLPKTLMAVEGGNHVNTFTIEEKKYRKELLQWLAKALAK